ncbi:MAG: MGMT family protein, partial [Rhodanobacter sp.]
ARAIGNACGNNKLALIVPCHRIVREDGSLGGWRWGVERKRELLAREHRQVGEPARRTLAR